MKRAIGLAIAAVASGSCVVGSPPGFSAGNSWSFPLVGPLENSQLLAPVFIEDKGPYLFAIDTDSPVSVIDDGVASETKPHGYIGARYDDEQDTTHPTKVADLLRIRIGTLEIHTRSVWVAPIGTFNVGGRQVRGVIGRDILTDSVIFGFDRDKGMGYIATPKGFTEPPGAQSFGYRLQTSHLGNGTSEMGVGGVVLPSGRHIATVSVNGKDELLHVNLGAVPSQLRDGKFQEAKLQVVPTKVVLVDEYGTQRGVDRAGVADQVSVGGVTVSGVRFVPYDDRRWEREDIDGSLGLGFFRDYAVWANWDKSKIYVVHRSGDLGPSTKERIGRWGSQQLSSCPHDGCIEVSMIAAPPPAAPSNAPGASSTLPGGSLGGNASAPGQPANAGGAIVHLQRDPGAADLNLEVVLEAVGKDGKPLGLPFMVASFPVGADTMTTQLDPAFGDATMRVVDASPFVRACPTGHACIYTLSAGE